MKKLILLLALGIFLMASCTPKVTTHKVCKYHSAITGKMMVQDQYGIIY